MVYIKHAKIDLPGTAKIVGIAEIFTVLEKFFDILVNVLVGTGKYFIACMTNVHDMNLLDIIVYNQYRWYNALNVNSLMFNT